MELFWYSIPVIPILILLMNNFPVLVTKSTMKSSVDTELRYPNLGITMNTSNYWLLFFCSLCTCSLLFWYMSIHLIWVSCLLCSYSCTQGNGCLHCKYTYFYTEVLAALLYTWGKNFLWFCCLCPLVQLVWTTSCFDLILHNDSCKVSHMWIPFSGVVIADGVLQNNGHFERHGMHHVHPEIHFSLSFRSRSSFSNLTPVHLLF